MDNGRVLLLDDDREILEICGEVLTTHGFEVSLYDAAPKALAALREGQRVDVVITDFRMPEMDGLAFMDEFKAMGYRIPVIMFTGVADKELAVRALNAGCHYLIEKPVRNQELIHYTEQALVYGRREHISAKLLDECHELIGLMQRLAKVYETRYTQAESIVYQNKSGAQPKPADIEDYLKNISQGLTIEAEVEKAKALVEALSREHHELRTRR